MARASAAVGLRSFKNAIRFGAVPLGKAPASNIRDCVWAVEVTSAWLPLRTMCIEKGLAVQHLLRRGGTDARLHYGARLEPGTGRLEAHVWVTVDGTIVIGGEAAPEFAEITSFPNENDQRGLVRARGAAQEMSGGDTA